MIETIAFQENRLQDFKYSGTEKKYVAKLDAKRLSASYAKLGSSAMFCVDGKLVAVGGVYQVLPGVGQAWLFANRAVEKTKGVFFRAVKTYLDTVITEMNYKQVNMMCLRDSFEGNNLAEHLNFKKQMDFTLYTRIGV